MSEKPTDLSPEETVSVQIEERKRWLFFGLPFTFTTYSMNNKKLTVCSGLLTTHEDDILFYRIMDTSLCRTLWQKLFGLGSIHVASSDQSLPALVIKNIRNAREFKDELDERVEKERLRMRVRTGELYDTDGEIDDFHHDL